MKSAVCSIVVHLMNFRDVGSSSMMMQGCSGCREIEGAAPVKVTNQPRLSVGVANEIGDLDHDRHTSCFEVCRKSIYEEKILEKLSN